MRSKLVLTHHPVAPSPQRFSGAGRGRDSKAENPQIPSLQLTSFWWMEIACHKSHQFLSIQSVTGKHVIFEIESFCRYWSEGQKTTIRLQPWRHMARLSVNIPKGLAIPASMRLFDLWKIVISDDCVSPLGNIWGARGKDGFSERFIPFPVLPVLHPSGSKSLVLQQRLSKSSTSRGSWAGAPTTTHKCLRFETSRQHISSRSLQRQPCPA